MSQLVWGRTQWVRFGLGWALSGLLLWGVFWYWPLDHWTLAPFVQDGPQPFGWREHPALTVLSHLWVKRWVIAIGVLVGIVALLGRWQSRWADWRWPGAYVVAAMVLAPTWVGLLKRLSRHSCPWDLQDYGGRSVAFELFAAVPMQAGSGHCFPGGHAASGFALLAFYFVARSAELARAYGYALAAVLMGLAMGWAQMMRGAHFLSHNLWTLWWTVGVQTLLWQGMTGWASRHGASLAAPVGMLSGFRIRR